MKIKKAIITVLFLAFVQGSYAQDFSSAYENDSLMSSSDTAFGESEIMRMFESLGTLPFFEEQYLVVDSAQMNPYGYGYDEVPVFEDSVYIKRIEYLASQTTLPLI